MTPGLRQEYLDAIATRVTLAALSRDIDADAGVDPLEKLRAAARMASELRGLGDMLLDRYVQAARADGRSWTEIGAALGVTKQAAHERFVDAPLSWPENFDDPARETVARAIEEARALGHSYLGTEHLLLALSAEGGMAGTTLAKLGVSEGAVRAAIGRIVGAGGARGRSALGITPRTKRVFKATIDEAKRAGRRRCAGNEHLLLALAGSEGVAAQILAEQGAGEETIREHVARLLEPEDPETAAKLRAPARRRGRGRARR